MSTENKVSTPDSTPAKPALNINLDYLVPTLSAICAGVIHHICNKKEALTYVDLLLIISPSLPVLLGVVIKIITFMINWLANGTQNMNLGFLGTMIQKMNSMIQFKPKIDNSNSFDEKGRIIFQKYTVNIDISKKLTEWQKDGYYINIFKNIKYDVGFDRFPSLSYILTHITGIEIDYNTSFVNFYHEFMIKNKHVIIYIENKNDNKYDIYFVSNDIYYLNPTNLYSEICPKVYSENTSYYRISRIYNEYRDELLHTVKMYKEKSTNKRKVCMNFCFAGPPGTSKTYGARAIAKELTREIFEINLSKIVYEEDFLALFSEGNVKKYVFLLDEIDLMCPSREFDDKLIKSVEETRLTTFGITKSNNVIDSESENSSLTEEEGFENKKLSHQITILQSEIRKLHEKMDKTSVFQDWLKSFLEKFYRVTNELLYISLMRCFTSISDVFAATTLSSINEYNNFFFKGVDGSTKVKQKLLEEKIFGINSSSNDSLTSNNSSISTVKTPFTLRTLLNFISGGNTHDDLVIIATTNRPEKLDPALIRPGRLRFIEFKNLRKEDAVCMLLENYPEEKTAIERGLDEIGYEDYMSNGALLEAIISSTHTLEKTLKTFQRELCNLTN